MRDYKKKYWWILTRDPDNGQPFLIKGGWSQEEARRKGLEMLQGLNFELRDLPTTDMGTASSIIRGKRLEETHDIRKARKRIGHERSVKRMMKRRSRA